MSGEKKPYGVTRNIIIIFDVILALLIIFFSYKILNTSLGSTAVIFGFVMLVVSVILKITQRW